MPKVVFVPSIDKYLMAFNGIVHTVLGGANDTWRMLWGYSSDGSTWSVYPNYLFRSSRESLDCESGFQVQDIDYENGYLYLLIGAIDQLNGTSFARPTSNRYYLLRSNVTSTAPHFGTWAIASGVDLYDRFVWTAVTASGTINAESVGYPLFSGEQAYSTSGAMAKICGAGGVGRWIFVTRRQYDPGINLWSSSSLSERPVFQSIINNQTGLPPSQYGWMFSFTKAGRSLPATDLDLASPTAFWIVAQTTSGTVQNGVDYRKVRLSLCGVAPFGPC